MHRNRLIFQEVQLLKYTFVFIWSIAGLCIFSFYVSTIQCVISARAQLMNSAIPADQNSTGVENFFGGKSFSRNMSRMSISPALTAAKKEETNDLVDRRGLVAFIGSALASMSIIVVLLVHCIVCSRGIHMHANSRLSSYFIVALAFAMKTIVFLVSESTLGPIFMQFCRKVISKTRIHKLKKIRERRQTKVVPMKSQTPEIRVNGNIRQFSIESQPTHIYSLPLSSNPSI
ncbi:uncharacterized protein LOC134840557 [Symsagittifera roscoffensis]|uniref:uncharacterized protein LOC134840557 n=1 Tax=Symsagittifera roscoffensis TaxID=84072 RepID=UPI00307B46AF